MTLGFFSICSFDSVSIVRSSALRLLFGNRGGEYDTHNNLLEYKGGAKAGKG